MFYEIITLSIVLAAGIAATIAAKLDGANKDTVSRITGK